MRERGYIGRHRRNDPAPAPDRDTRRGPDTNPTSDNGRKQTDTGTDVDPAVTGDLFDAKARSHTRDHPMR
ncbi:hypothetical protein [Actinokineospora sp.]|uniref:hypothetical protein n=1 Tax=Actinokineospora sp. TaxID=1872133 RepID=UPI003D6A4DDE